jgi:hypothetical protein
MDLAKYIADEAYLDPVYNYFLVHTVRSGVAQKWIDDMNSAAVDEADGTAIAEKTKVAGLFSKQYLDYPGAICVQTYRGMMDAAIEDAKATKIINAKDADADAKKGARKFFEQTERVLNKTKVESFVEGKPIPNIPRSSVTVQMMLYAGSVCLKEHKYINASSIQTRARSKGKGPVREGIYDGVVENPPSCSAEFGGYFKS